MKLQHYEEIDWRALEKPEKRLEICLTQYQNRLSTGLIIFFGAVTLLNLTQLFRSVFTTTNDIIIKGGFFSGLILALIGFLIFRRIRAKRRLVRFFDASGVTRGDGRHFLWSDFRGAIKRITSSRYGSRYNWRTELIFGNGDEAWVIPQRIKNFREVYSFVETLPPAVLKDIK